MKKIDIKNSPIIFCSKDGSIWFDEKIPINNQIRDKIFQLAKLMGKQKFWKSLDSFKNKHHLDDDYNQKLLNWLESKIKKLTKEFKMKETITKMKQLINLVGPKKFWEMLSSWKEIQKEKNPKLKKLKGENVIDWLDEKLEIYKHQKS